MKLLKQFFCSVEGLPHEKDRGARREFRKEPLRGSKILFCERGLKSFSALRGISSKTTNYSARHCFELNTLKGTVKASAVKLLKILTA